MNIHPLEEKQLSLLDSKCIDQPAHMRMLINVFTFNRFICLHMRLIILSLACIGFLISDRCHVRFATLVDNKGDVRYDIEYT